MGLSDDDMAVRTGSWGNWAVRIAVTSLIGSMFFAVFVQWSRGAHLVSPVLGLELVPAAIAGATFAVVSWSTRRLNGGFVYFQHVFVFWVLGAIAHAMGAEHTFIMNGLKEKEPIFRSSDKFFKRLRLRSLIWYFLAMGPGYYLGGILSWGVLAGWASPAGIMTVTPYSPGMYPGFNAAERLPALLAEIFSSAIITSVIMYFYMVNRSDKIPMAGGLAVFIATALSFNVSGGAFGILWWTMSHLAACSPVGNVCFPGASLWWWAYVGGSLGGSFLGAILALVIFRFSPLERAVARTGSTAQAVATAQRGFGMTAGAGIGMGAPLAPSPGQGASQSDIIADVSNQMWGAVKD